MWTVDTESVIYGASSWMCVNVSPDLQVADDAVVLRLGQAASRGGRKVDTPSN